MFLWKLIIYSNDEILREIKFVNGLNLIVDETPKNEKDNKKSGNNIGKTTVLKLINYCLGGKADEIFLDEETKQPIKLVEEFIQSNDVLIELQLTNDIVLPTEFIKIKRNFSTDRIDRVSSINDVNYNKTKEKDFINELGRTLLEIDEESKPSFKQLIAHNIRYNDTRINNTLKILHNFTSNIEYETLFLKMMGIDVVDTSILRAQYTSEKTFQDRLKKENDETKLKLELDLVLTSLRDLEKQKRKVEMNEQYFTEFEQLTAVRKEISLNSRKLSEFILKRELIKETEEELKSEVSEVDSDELKEIYSVSKLNIEGIQKEFEDLVAFHNNMIMNKIKFIVDELPNLDAKIEELQQTSKLLIQREKELSGKLIHSLSYNEYEELLNKINELYQEKGEIEARLESLRSIDEKVSLIEEKLEILNAGIFSEKFQEKVMEQVKRFNQLFSFVSQELYGERYFVSYSIVEKENSKYYLFKSDNSNTSSGKKQGEIICFDIAYILFARQEGIPHLDFLLNDKKELMHGNQLEVINKFALEYNIQIIFSILKDKIPSSMINEHNVILSLSQEEKLFKIESTLL